MIRNAIQNGDLILMPDFRDVGLVLGARRHGENGVILSLFTKQHGRYLGLLRVKTLPLVGSFVEAKWRARLSEHLGNYTCETISALSAAYMEDKHRLAAISSLCTLLDESLPEREPLPDFYEQVCYFLNQLENKNWLMAYIRLEALLLKILGFGLDLTHCAGGGDCRTLAYVSPRTAKAVSQEKGAPYSDKLLILPRFLWQDCEANSDDLRAGLFLTGYFLAQHITLPRTRANLL